MQHHKKVIKLSLFFFFLLFLAGRIGLFLHEFAGHALAWHVMGGRLAGFRLFIFGGGRVQYDQMHRLSNLSLTQQLTIQLSGIVVELAVGIILAVLVIFLSTTRSIKALLVSLAGVLIVHALFYLTVGTYYGSGDGHLLFNLFQEGVRRNFLIFTSTMAFGAAFLISYQFSPIIKSWLEDGYINRGKWIILCCACIAVLFHTMLTIGERILVNDTGYARIKTSENERLKAAELSKFIAAYIEKYGTQPDNEQIQNLKKELKKKFWQFPLDIFLGIGIVVVSLFGFFKSRHDAYQDSDPITWKDVFCLGSTSMVVAGLILVLNQI